MIKQVSFFRRRKDLSPEDFREHWRTKHADVVRRLNGLVRYVQNHGLNSSSGFDGIAEVWFEDMESMRANVDTPELESIRIDESIRAPWARLLPMNTSLRKPGQLLWVKN